MNGRRADAGPLGRSERSGRQLAWLGELSREITAGAVVGCLALPFCVIAGVLAYEPLGPDYAGRGAAAGILCGVVGGLVGALARTSSFIPNLPSSTMSLIQASLVGSLMAGFDGNPAIALGLMPLCIVLAGIWQMLIAVSGLARAVKFTPYPVLAGFLTGLAILILIQQGPRLFGSTSLASLTSSLASGTLSGPALPLFGVGLVLLIFAIERFWPRMPALLVALLVGSLSFHALKGAFPALHLGETIGSVAVDTVSLGISLDPGILLESLHKPDIVRTFLLTSATLAVLGTLDLTFSLRAAQNVFDLEAAPVRNLAGQGMSNVLAALSGGLMVTTSLSLGMTIFGGGGRSRISTITVAVILLLLALLVPSLISHLPNLVLSAILVSIAFRLWDRWCVTLVRDLARRGEPDTRVRARRNAAIVIAVAAATVLGQPVVGALVGVVLSCLVFILEMSRPIVRRRLDGSQVFSKRIRSQNHGAWLRRDGSRTGIFELQGVLFFGNADDLASAIKSVEKSVDVIILDLRRVTDLDTSGATVLSQIAARCRQNGIALLIAGARQKFDRTVADALGPDHWTLVFHDLDTALEMAEDRLLGREASGSAAWNTLNVEQTDFAAGLSDAELTTLRQHLLPERYAAGTTLCHAGEPADRLWLLTRGSVSIRLPGERSHRRIAGLGPGTSVGELGLLDRRPRSADVVADEEVEAFVLTAEAFDQILSSEPHLGQSILAAIARMTAQRLRATSEELRLADA